MLLIDRQQYFSVRLNGRSDAILFRLFFGSERGEPGSRERREEEDAKALKTRVSAQGNKFDTFKCNCGSIWYLLFEMVEMGILMQILSAETEVGLC